MLESSSKVYLSDSRTDGRTDNLCENSDHYLPAWTVVGLVDQLLVGYAWLCYLILLSISAHDLAPRLQVSEKLRLMKKKIITSVCPSVRLIHKARPTYSSMSYCHQFNKSIPNSIFKVNLIFKWK